VIDTKPNPRRPKIIKVIEPDELIQIPLLGSVVGSEEI
jgi:hypothetical protein